MDNTEKSRIDELRDSGKEYINLRIDEIKLKSVENLAKLSNKLIVLLLAIMLGGVILQLSGLALSYFIGQLVGNTALGFLLVAIFFLLVLLLLFIFRDKLFLNKLVKLFVGIFFDTEIQSVDVLKREQEALRQKIVSKEMEISYKYKELKMAFNPITYVNKILSKFTIVESLIQSFYNGYKSVVNIFAKRKATKTSGDFTVSDESTISDDPTMSKESTMSKENMEL